MCMNSSLKEVKEYYNNNDIDINFGDNYIFRNVTLRSPNLFSEHRLDIAKWIYEIDNKVINSIRINEIYYLGDKKMMNLLIKMKNDNCYSYEFNFTLETAFSSGNLGFVKWLLKNHVFNSILLYLKSFKLFSDPEHFEFIKEQIINNELLDNEDFISDYFITTCRFKDPCFMKWICDTYDYELDYNQGLICASINHNYETIKKIVEIKENKNKIDYMILFITSDKQYIDLFKISYLSYKFIDRYIYERLLVSKFLGLNKKELINKIKNINKSIKIINTWMFKQYYRPGGVNFKKILGTLG